VKNTHFKVGEVVWSKHFSKFGMIIHADHFEVDEYLRRHNFNANQERTDPWYATLFDEIECISRHSDLVHASEAPHE
jgi:hypothetical protein